MKQHITSKQWEVIDGTYKDIWFSIFYSEFTREMRITEEFWNRVFKLPNIGQMIEFLGDDWTKVFADGDATSMSRDNLCDALWEKVKLKLNN